MQPITMATDWLQAWNRGAALDCHPLPNVAEWVAEFHERSRLALAQVAADEGPWIDEEVDQLMDEIVPAVVNSLPPSGREHLRQRNQLAIDAVRAAINVWTLSGIDALLAEDDSLDNWRDRMLMTFELASSVRHRRAPQVVPFRPAQPSPLEDTGSIAAADPSSLNVKLL